jgi:putative transposase
MPWNERSVIGERRRLVLVLLRKEKSVRYWCRVFGVSRKTAYKWKQRFIQGGQRGLADRARRPERMPRRLKGQAIKRIEYWRRKHADWGPKKLRVQMQRRGRRSPSARTIARWIKRLGLVDAPPRRPPKACVRAHRRLTKARRPNHVWTVDFKGWFRTGNGERCEPLTVRDLFSRYGLVVRLLPTQHWGPVQAVFTKLFQAVGRPQIIRVDNGGPFASVGPAGLSRLSVWWLRLGIVVEFTRPGCPQDNGAHEQFHRVMKRETIRPAAWSRRGQQHRTTIWLKDYNRNRPHEALGQRRPRELYRKSRRRFPARLLTLPYRSIEQVRRVRSNGEIRWGGRKRFVGEAFVGQQVALRGLRRGVWSVYFTKLLIGHLHQQDVGAMRPALYRHRRSNHPKPKV